jgi:hypothetical protein
MADEIKETTATPVPEISKEQEIKDLRIKVTKYLEMEKVTDLLSKNVIEFDYAKDKYRVSRPTFKQKAEVNEQRIVKYIELIKNPKYVMEKDLIKIYKDRGIDIEDMDSQIKVLDDKKNALLYKLGESIKSQAQDSDLKILKDEIEKLTVAQQEISLRKIVYLDTAIESQLNVYIYTYFAFLLTEKLDGDKWVRVWSDYDSFMNESENLINTLTFYISFVIKPELPNV